MLPVIQTKRNDPQGQNQNNNNSANNVRRDLMNVNTQVPTNPMLQPRLEQQESLASPTILSPGSAAIIPSKFSPPYQLALINITWIFFGFSYLMRYNQQEGQMNSNNNNNIDNDVNNQGFPEIIIGSSLIVFGCIGLFIWKFYFLSRKISVENLSKQSQLILVIVFMLSQIAAMEALLHQRNIANCWVITGSIVQMSYVQSISRASILNLAYTGASTLYMIVRFQFLLTNWEWQSLIYSLLVCTVIIFHSEKVHSKTHKQTKEMISSNQKATRLNNFYYDILGLIPEGVAIFDKKQTTIFCNKTIKDLFQCKKQELNKILLSLSTSQQNNPAAPNSTVQIPSHSPKKSQLTNSFKRNQNQKPASQKVIQTSQSNIPPGTTTKEQSQIKLNLSDINLEVNQVKSMLSPCFHQLCGDSQQQQCLNQKLNGINEDTLKVVSADSSSTHHALEKGVTVGGNHNQIDLTKINLADHFIGATFAKLQTKDLASPSNSLLFQRADANSGVMPQQKLSSFMQPVYNYSFADQQIPVVVESKNQLDMNEIAELNESKRELVSGLSAVNQEENGRVSVSRSQRNLISQPAGGSSSGGHHFHHHNNHHYYQQQQGGEVSAVLAEEEDESEIDILKNLGNGDKKQVFKRRMFKQKESNDIMQGETKVSDILGDLFGNSSSQSQIIGGGGGGGGAAATSSVKEFGKSKTFFSQMNQNQELGYLQFQEDMIKVQVQWKKQIFVLKFLLFEIETAENQSEEFILVLVDPLWQEYYNKKIEEVQKYKMKMFASLSHELRTPLNCTISMLEGIEQFITDQFVIDEQAACQLVEIQLFFGIVRYLYPALHSQKLLLNQINDILDFAQIDSGKFKYTFVEFDLLKLLLDCQTLMQMQANLKTQDLEIIFDDRLNSTVKSDPNRIRQVLLNFLSNSLKFTPELGSITIKAEPVFSFLRNDNSSSSLGAAASATATANGIPGSIIQQYIRLTVTDTGIGMKPETLKNIFKAFNKTEYENETINSQGCGLGLAISQSISRGLCTSSESIPQSASGIQVKSIFGQGSSFSFIIQDMNPRPLQIQESPSNRSQSSIMDNQQQMMVLHMMNEDALLTESNASLNYQNSPQKSPNTYEIDSCYVPESEYKDMMTPQQSAVAGLITVQVLKSLSQQQSLQAKMPQLRSLMSPSYQGQTTTGLPPTSLDLAASSQILAENNSFSLAMTSLQRKVSAQEAKVQLNSSSSSLTRNISQQSRMIPSTQKITSSNLSRTLTNNSLSKMNSAIGFTGYHSKVNMAEDLTNKLLGALQRYIECGVCENKCAPVLIVDDNQFNILALSRVLQTFFQIPFDKAFDGQQALNKINHRYNWKEEEAKCTLCRKYEVIFMDIEMPILNGYEVMKELTDMFKENSINKEDKPYIVACTAHGGDNEVTEAKIHGFDDYITKPIMKADLAKLLCDWFYFKQPNVNNHNKIRESPAQIK